MNRRSFITNIIAAAVAPACLVPVLKDRHRWKLSGLGGNLYVPQDYAGTWKWVSFTMVWAPNRYTVIEGPGNDVHNQATMDRLIKAGGWLWWSKSCGESQECVAMTRLTTKDYSLCGANLLPGNNSLWPHRYPLRNANK